MTTRTYVSGTITDAPGGYDRWTGIDDDATGWFDRDRAERWSEYTRWDGNNNRGRASGGQCGYQELYRTAGGRWVLHSDFSSEFNGPDEYLFCSLEWAQDWAVRAGLDDEDMGDAFGELDAERGPGQPPVGPGSQPRKVTMDDAMWSALDDRARRDGTTRGDLIRAAVTAYLERP